MSKYRNWVELFAIIGLVVCGSRAHAQQLTKLPRIGYVRSTIIPARQNAFRQGLLELGYFEGKNIVIEWRSSEGNHERLRAVVAELIRLNVDLIVTSGSGVTRATREATVTIPIVMTQDNDPVGSGIVASLARPGGNVTGLSNLAPELSGKRLELLREIIPKLARVAVFGTSTNPANAQSLEETELAADAFGVKLQYLDVLNSNDIENAFRSAGKGRADAILILVAGPVLNPHRAKFAELAKRSRVPAIYRNREDVEAGGLMSYGVSLTDLDRRSAMYVDKILKGRTPADLPVEQPTKFELMLNLRTAKQIGLTIPAHVLARADRVIK